jgi:hypothetical protein
MLPAAIQPSSISMLSLQVNFKGTSSSNQTWTWSIFDWSTRKWLKVGSATGRDSTPWQTLRFDTPLLPQHVSTGGEIRIQLRSTNGTGEARIDYEVLQLTLGSNPAMQSLQAPSATTTPLPQPIAPSSEPTSLPPSPTAVHKH